ncbi:hypothetical protein [Aquicoccus sp.]|uniref:hypothetical protein n=1 Tax=Aquicoccus sp. TaxID=2055851 RepID=UPI0035621092
METRTTRSKLTFLHDFTLTGSDELLPAGEYDLVVEEERLQGLTFVAYRQKAAFLQVTGNPRSPGRTEMRPVSNADLKQALGRDHDPAAGSTITTDAHTVPQKDMT